MDRLTTNELAQRLGMPLTIGDVLKQHRLRWLGHVARMEDQRLPKQLLFGEGTATRPRHGPKRRWRDLATADIRAQEIPESEWYALAQDREGWRQQCEHRPRKEQAEQAAQFTCRCGRTFRRSGDLKRHQRFC